MRTVDCVRQAPRAFQLAGMHSMPCLSPFLLRSFSPFLALKWIVFQIPVYWHRTRITKPGGLEASPKLSSFPSMPARGGESSRAGHLVFRGNGRHRLAEEELKEAIMATSCLLLVTLFVAWREPPPKLVLKENVLVSKDGGVSSIVPLNDRYLCIAAGLELKILDSGTNKIIFADGSLQKVSDRGIQALIIHKNYIYAQVIGDIFYYRFEWTDKTKPPQIEAARKMDLKGEKVDDTGGSHLWSVNDVALFFTESKKIHWLDEGKVIWEKSVDLLRVAKDMAEENYWKEKFLFVKLIPVESQARLLVGSSKRVRVYDPTSMKAIHNFTDEKIIGMPDDAIYAEDRYVFVYYGWLGVFGTDGKLRVIKCEDREDRCRWIQYVKTKKVFLVWPRGSIITVISLDGQIGNNYDHTSYIGPAVYVKGNTIFVGLGAYGFREEFVGGGYLRVYEIK